MKTIVTAAQMRELDKNTIEKHHIPSAVLMERAALAVVEALSGFDLTRTLVICGDGNNGGDGIAVARMLHKKGIFVEVYQPGKGVHASTECALQEQIARSYKVTWVNNPDFSEYTTIVDALFGVGLARPIEGDYAALVEQVNKSPAEVLAVDMPTGIHADHGHVMGTAVKADCTVSFAFAKAGQLLYPGSAYCGRLTVCDIGIYEESQGYKPGLYALEKQDLSLIPARMPDGNKGTFGKALLVAGSYGMAGASYLSGLAAMRTGCGMLRIVTPEENREILQRLLPEAMVAAYRTTGEALALIGEGLDWADVAGVGPGLGRDDTADDLVQYMLRECRKPLVVDADGLNILSAHMDWLEERRGPCIVTPHPGEMARLSGKTAAEIRENSPASARVFAKAYGVCCVLKDARTCTALPDGTVYINTTGNCGMATAGSGDVLTGIIMGLLAQGTPFAQCAALSVLLHGLAGDSGKEKYGTAYLMAGNLIEELASLRIGELQGDEYEEI